MNLLDGEWVERLSASNGRPYLWNAKTKQSRWRWVRRRSKKTGQDYFLDLLTSQTKWAHKHPELEKWVGGSAGAPEHPVTDRKQGPVPSLGSSSAKRPRPADPADNAAHQVEGQLARGQPGGSSHPPGPPVGNHMRDSIGRLKLPDSDSEVSGGAMEQRSLPSYARQADAVGHSGCVVVLGPETLWPQSWPQGLRRWIEECRQKAAGRSTADRLDSERLILEQIRSSERELSDINWEFVPTVYTDIDRNEDRIWREKNRPPKRGD